MSPNRRLRGRGSRGQSTVEFALATVAIVLLLGGLIDLGRAFASSITLQDAVREGARHGAWFDQSNRTNPYLYDAAIKSAVDSVLVDAGMKPSVLMNSTTTCPSVTDGNSSYNPPYANSAYPATGGTADLYICYEDTAGVDLTSAPADSSPYRLKDLNVIILFSYQLLTDLLPLSGGVVHISENWHQGIQGHA